MPLRNSIFLPLVMLLSFLWGGQELIGQEAQCPCEDGCGSAPPLFCPGTGDGEGKAEEDPWDEPIETDRASFTPAFTTVGLGRLTSETSYTFTDNRGVKETHSFPELLLRYGLADRLEVRLGWNYEVGGAGTQSSGVGFGDEEFTTEMVELDELERESRITYGLKYEVTEAEGWVPGSAVILQGFTPTSGGEQDSQFVATYVFGWVLPNRCTVEGAFRYATGSEEEDRFSLWAPSALVRVPLGKQLNFHAEYFGIFSSDRETDSVLHFVSPGMHYLITPDLEVGFRVGWGLNDQSARFFANAGVGWRF